MYNNSFSRSNPGLVVIMIDQSGSMCLTSSKNNLELCENAANSVNNLVNEFILKLTTMDSDGEEIVKRSLRLVLIGYGGPNDEAYVICDKWIDEVESTYPKGQVKMTTREGTFPQDCIVVVDPVADNCTPMAWAMSIAKDKVSEWVNNPQHSSANDPVPVVINISDGAPTDSDDDVRKYAKDIMSLNIPDGNPRIFNIHISANSSSEIRFPNSKSGMDSESELLYDISSEVTQDLVETIPELLNYSIKGGEKMMMSNVSDPAVLVQFLKIGTIQKLR